MHRPGFLFGGPLILLLAACNTLAQTATPATLPAKTPATEYVFYRWEGGLSRYAWIEVRIQTDGQSTVSYLAQREQPITMTLQLSPSEMQALETRIRAAGDINLPAESPIPVGDGGRTTLRLTRNGRLLQGSYGHFEPLEPTAQFTYKLLNQAVILHDLETKDDAYAALGAISDSYSAPKVLQRGALEAPLRALMHRSSDMTKLGYALQALSNLVSPDELMGLCAAELETATPERQITLMHALTSGGAQVSAEHRRALIPLLSLKLRAVAAKIPELPGYQKQVYESTIRFLGGQRNAQAVPVLILLAEAHAEATDTNQGTRESIRVALAETGYSAIGPLTTLLDHKSAAIRTFAGDTLCMLITINPSCRSADERNQAISYLKQIVTNFEARVRNDADPNAREALTRAIGLIKSQ